MFSARYGRDCIKHGGVHTTGCYSSLFPEIRVPLTEQVIQPIVEDGAANLQ